MSRKERRASHKLAARAQKPSLDEALALHQANRLTEAESLYRDLLAKDPMNADALNLLGLIHLQRQDAPEAIKLIEQAIAFNGKVARFHYNAANAYVSHNAPIKASTYYERALELDPAFAQAANNLGYIHLNQNRPNTAAELFQRALTSMPDYPEAYNNLGLAEKSMGHMPEAIKAFEKAIKLKPDFATAHNNLGVTLRAMDKLEQAIDHYERALAIRPGYAEARNNLGNALRDFGLLTEAFKQVEAAIALHPDFAEAHSNLGTLYKDGGDHEKALAQYQRAIALNPGFATAYYNIGAIYQEQGRNQDAMTYYNHALQIDPGHGDTLWNRAVLLLLVGDYARGWPEYERRWLKKGIEPHGLSTPLWNGGDLTGQTILIHCEQGLGDSLQFVRYVPLVQQRGGRVLLRCPSPLVRLFENSLSIDAIIPEGAATPPHDCRVPLMSLPMLFGTTLDNVPNRAPYLTPPAHDVAQWQNKIQTFTGLKVGLVWAGNPRTHNAEAHAVDRRRSVKLEDFAPLAECNDVTFFSLQKGEPAAQLHASPQGLRIVDFMNEVRDFADTAALIANLDLVIGVDTSVIHVAGALGKPTWVLSRFDGCWRWLLDREDSPWYPTMRLFRQTWPGQWDDAIANVKQSLAQLAQR